MTTKYPSDYRAKQDWYDYIDDKFNAFEKRFEKQLNDHMLSCRELCTTKIINIDQKVEKAHERLNNQKEAIEELCSFKSEERGFRRAITIGMSLITVVIMAIGLKEVF